MAINMLLFALDEVSSRNKFKRAFLKVFNAIGAAYARDKDFINGATFFRDGLWMK